MKSQHPHLCLGVGAASATSGYTGGRTVKPTYEQVSGDLTGYAEVVEVVYNPAVVTGD